MVLILLWLKLWLNKSENEYLGEGEFFTVFPPMTAVVFKSAVSTGTVNYPK
jgi:hypothetical protein